MKVKFIIKATFLVLFFTCFTSISYAQFTSGRLVVLQVGDGSAALSNAAAPVFLKEFTTTGTAGVSVTIPITGTTRLVASGSSTSDGQITLSADKKYISIAGYDAAVGTASITGTASATVNRVVNNVDATAVVTRGVSTSTVYSGNNFRSTVKSSNDDYWGAGGNSGTYYFGNSTTAATIQNSTTNTRVINIFNGNLYFSTGSGTIGLYSITGLQTSSNSATNLIATGTGTSPYAFAINAAGNVAYIADDRASGTAGGVQKWIFSGSLWSLAYNFNPATGTGTRGLAVDFSGANPILYATTTDNKLVSFTDAGATSPATVLSTAPTNTVFRSVTFAPITPAPTPTVNLSVSTNTSSEAAATVVTVTATASAAVTGNQTVTLAVSGTNITAGDYTLSNTTITIPNGGTTGTVTFTIVDDAVVESTETAVLTISAPSAGISLGSTTTQNITITDNDAAPPPTVNLSVSTNAGSEENKNTITITATASAAVVGDQTVTLNIAGSGITVHDYFGGATTIVIPETFTTGTTTITIRNDAELEGNETLALTISNPSAGIQLGSTVTQNVVIADNTCQPLIRKATQVSTNGAEISAFDSASKRLYTVAGTAIEYYTMSNAGVFSAPTNVPFGFTSVGNTILPNSVAIKNGIVAISYAIVDVNNAQQLGKVAFYTASTGAYISDVTVGYLPDMVLFTPDGTKLLTANEGEPNSYGQGTSFDPEGSVSIIDIASGVASATVQTAGFTSFNSQIAGLRAAGVRIYGPGATVAQDLEPEYITFSANGSKAIVTLQENNAIAEVDIATATVTNIYPLGYKNHNTAGNGFDASDQDGPSINIQNWKVLGMYQPDAISSFVVGGTQYYITANEGDSRALTGLNEEARVSTLTLDATAYPTASTLKLAANLGRLQLTNATGDTDGDGDIDQLYALGARSFSIWNSTFTQIFDSGDKLEQVTATENPRGFNGDPSAPNTPLFDTRSDNKGPEPEGVVTGIIDGVLYAFVGSERTGDILVYDISNPAAPVFKQYIDHPDDRQVEGLLLIPAIQSPTGKALIVVSAELSKTVTVYEFSLVNNTLATTTTIVNATQSTTTTFGNCTSLVAKVNQITTDPNTITGTVTSTVWIEPTVPTSAGKPYVQRHYEITPASNAATATGIVTLYFTQTEFDNFNADPASTLDLPTGPSDVVGIDNLQIIKYSGTSNNGTGLPVTYTSTPTPINPANADIVWNSTFNRWEISFITNGFSGFFVQTDLSILAVNWLTVTGKLSTTNQAILNWKVQENNVVKYSIEKSTNANNYTEIGGVNSAGNGTNNYSYTDNQPITGTTYYRIKQTDHNGKISYSSIVKLTISKGLIATIYPNPTSVTTTLQVSNNYVNTKAYLFNSFGVLLNTINITNNSTTINVTALKSGVYWLKLNDGTTLKFERE